MRYKGGEGTEPMEMVSASARFFCKVYNPNTLLPLDEEDKPMDLNDSLSSH